MDQDTIQKIAQETAHVLSNYSWQLLAVQAVLTVLAFASGVLFGVYHRTQVSKTQVDSPRTFKNGTVDETLGQENWRKREWAHLRRTKLEVLLSKVHDCEHYVSQNAASQATRWEERDPLSELEIMKTLYFPELKGEIDDFLHQCRAQNKVTIDTSRTDFKTARDRLDAAAQILTTEIMGIGDQPQQQAGLHPMRQIDSVTT
jgi:hypothetical protein